MSHDSAHSTTITMMKVQSDMHSQMTSHTSPLVSYTKNNDRDISRAHCIPHVYQTNKENRPSHWHSVRVNKVS